MSVLVHQVYRDVDERTIRRGGRARDLLVLERGHPVTAVCRDVRVPTLTPCVYLERLEDPVHFELVAEPVRWAA